MGLLKKAYKNETNQVQAHFSVFALTDALLLPACFAHDVVLDLIFYTRRYFRGPRALLLFRCLIPNNQKCRDVAAPPLNGRVLFTRKIAYRAPSFASLPRCLMFLPRLYVALDKKRVDKAYYRYTCGRSEPIGTSLDRIHALHEMPENRDLCLFIQNHVFCCWMRKYLAEVWTTEGENAC